MLARSAALLARPAGYAEWLTELKTRIHAAQQRAALSVNRELLSLYWQLGRDLLERQAAGTWGSGVIDQVSTDLRAAFPEMRGFSPSNLKYMRAFAEAWPDFPDRQQAVGELPWGHNVVLLTKLKQEDQRLGYAQAAVSHGWSRNVLVHHIEFRTVERQGKALTNFEQQLPKPQSDLALYLLTTGAAPKASAASYLRSEGRDVAKALSILEAVPLTSESQANAEAYKAFLAASPTARRAIIDTVVVLDRAPGVLSIDDDLKAEVHWTANPHHDAFLQRLEGWWLRRVIKQLSASPKTDGILSAELEAEMSDLREQFREDSLPIDEDLVSFTLDDATQTAHEDYQFVHQLRLIDAGKRRVAAAIRDFYRAYQQRSRWLREDLLLVGDLSRYEGKLQEEWELVFEATKDEIEATAAEAAKRKAARSVLAWAERAAIAIRPGVTEPFVVRGSFHMLADETPPRIGWHPDFQDRLAKILNPSRTVPPSDAAECDAQ